MTRINVLAPCGLTDQHLLAEYRELPRVFTLARNALPLNFESIPRAYTLGTGHVRFFYPRTGFLAHRQAGLIRELLDRGYALTHQSAPEPVTGLDQDWTPDEEAVRINLTRLRERLLKTGARYTLRGVPVDAHFYGSGSGQVRLV